jgi:mevalonate kinase
MKRFASGVAPGKVILLGEHSVVFGEPAIAAAIERRLEVRARFEDSSQSSDDPRLTAAIAAAGAETGIDPAQIRVEIRSDIPPACGLGSSAALSLALVRALASLTDRSLNAEELLAGASRVENVFHGTASGVDVAACGSSGVIWFERATPPRIERLTIAKPLELVIAASGEQRSTAGPVGRLRERRTQRPELYGRLFRLAGDLVREARGALERGDAEALGTLMDVAHGLLNGWGVSTPGLERAVAVARAAGALGAKLSGAGGGGVIVALAPGRAPAVVTALRDAGFESFTTTIGGGAQEVEDARSKRASA